MSTQANQVTSPTTGTKLSEIDYDIFGKETFHTNPLDAAKMNEGFGGGDFLLQDLAGHSEHPSGRRASLTGSLPAANMPASHSLLTGGYEMHHFDTPPGSRNTWSAARSPRPEMGQRSRSNSLTGELEPLLDHLLPHLPQASYVGTPSFKSEGGVAAGQGASGPPYGHAADAGTPGALRADPPPAMQGSSMMPGAPMSAAPAVGNPLPADRDGAGRGMPMSPVSPMPQLPVMSPSTSSSNAGVKRDNKGAVRNEGPKRKQSMPAEEKAKVRAEQSRTSSRLYRLRKKEFQQHLEQHCDSLRQQQERVTKELATAQEVISKLQEENNALRNLVQSLQAARR